MTIAIANVIALAVAIAIAIATVIYFNAIDPCLVKHGAVRRCTANPYSIV